MNKRAIVSVAMVMAAGSGLAESAGALDAMKIREVTVFKDGHSFVLHSGKMPVNDAGNVVLDHLPAPVLGTFWPYSSEKGAPLRSVVAGQHKVSVEKTALNLREMIEANLGAEVVVTDQCGKTYEATILSIPTRSSAELKAHSADASDHPLDQKGDIVLLKTVQGIKPLAFSNIADLVFVSERNAKGTTEEFRNRLTLDLNWKGAPRAEAEVGMVYLQRGIRWIPNYKIEINERGKAMVKLQATVINELADISDVTAHLVVGVPSFAFKDSVDPISLRADVARLASSNNRQNQTSFAFSNLIMSQVSMPSVQSGQPGGGMDLGPEMSRAGKSEDLYMFTLEHITLRKGERMVLPITEYELDFEDVYALNIPFAPPTDVFKNLGRNERRDIMTLQSGPKVMHKIRLHNKSSHPFTTAPAMIMKDGLILAQGMMTYTPVGGKVDVDLTTAVDITVKKSDNETARTPDAEKWNGDRYFRVDLTGKIALKNYKSEPVTIEVTRYVLGHIDEASNAGAIIKINPFEDRSFVPDAQTSAWWYSYSWPWWWYHFNTVGQVTWTTELKPNESADHEYSWHYYWR